MYERKAEKQFEELANELIDAGAVALTAIEDTLCSRWLFVTVHGPYFPEERALIQSVCDGIESVRIDGHRFDFDYECDPDPPTPLGKVELYIPERFAADDELSCCAVTLDEGLDRVVLYAE